MIFDKNKNFFCIMSHYGQSVINLLNLSICKNSFNISKKKQGKYPFFKFTPNKLLKIFFFHSVHMFS
jgi:hypothetical protein